MIASLQGSRRTYLQTEKAKSTVASYVGDIKAFLEWLEDKGVEFQGQLHRVHATAYKKFLVEAEYQFATINKKIKSLSSFNSYLIEQGLAQEKAVDPRRDRVKVARGSEKEVQVFTEDEVEKLLFHVADKRKVNHRESATETQGHRGENNEHQKRQRKGEVCSGYQVTH